MKYRFDALLARACRCEDELQALALYEEAIVIADRYLTESDAYRARMDYSEKAVETCFYDKLLVSFAWCWTKFVERPERYSSFYMMWHFKWVVEDLHRFAVYPSNNWNGCLPCSKRTAKNTITPCGLIMRRICISG